MLAISQVRGGGVEVLRPRNLPVPEPGPGEVLVRVHAAGVNPADIKIRERGRFPSGETPPFVLGFDVSGSIAEVGEGVTVLEAGDEVFGMPRFPHPAGAYAEYVAAPARHLARKPVSMSHREAAALTLAGLTAWQALVDTADMRPGERVLVHAAAGGVGHLAVQVAVSLGARVVAASSTRHHDLLTSLGAQQTIDRHGDELDDLEPVDVVLDPVGDLTTRRSLELLRRGGRLVRLPAWTATEHTLRAQAELRGIRAVRMLVEPDLAGLRALTNLVDRDLLRPIVSGVFALHDARRAHRLVQLNRTVGKIVLSV